MNSADVTPVSGDKHHLKAHEVILEEHKKKTVKHMKRKIETDNFNSKMMKIETSGNDKLNSVLKPVTRISNSLSRNFGYKLSDKKAKSNFLKAAARESLEIDEKQKCTMFLFSVGSYMESVIPSAIQWKNGSQEFRIDDLFIKIESIMPGYDKNGKHVETIITFSVNDQKVVVVCYNTTQKVKVEGNGYIEFCEKYIKKLFINLIREASVKIDDYNKAVVAALSGKRKAVSRPVRSVRYKAMAKLACNQCEISFLNTSQLSVHKRSLHTSSSKDDSANLSKIPIVDDLSLMDLSMEANHHQELELEERCPDINICYECDKCEHKALSEEDLNVHKVNVHTKKAEKLQETSTSTVTSEQFACSECNFHGEDQGNLDEHGNTHVAPKEVDPVIYHCGKCENKYEVFDDLARHIDNQHKDNKRYSCAQCDFSSGHYEGLELHKNSVHSEKEGNSQPIEAEVYICGECCLRFSTFVECEKHTETHSPRCFKCDFRSEDKTKLTEHEKNAHKSSKWERKS